MTTMTAFSIKQRDTSPSLLADLTPSDVDITGATGVVFNMRPRGSMTPTISRATAVIVTPTGPARLRYNWQAGDTATAGQYLGEFEVTRADGSVETFPNKSYIEIIIEDDIE